MNSRPQFQFKIASEDWEVELIHRLNYKTFVKEIPQHEAPQGDRLVDKFHAENTYVICLCGNQLAGMLAVRGRRPFSLDYKLASLDSYLPPGRSVCEVRLLAVEKEFRTGQVFPGLLLFLWQYGIQQGYDLAIISGTTRQLKLYAHLGFTPFGPLVGTGETLFQPMYMTKETFEANAKEILQTAPAHDPQAAARTFVG